MTALADALDDRSLPRSNGELVFEAPWQGRALAMAVTVVDRLDLEWDDFRRQLIASIESAPERPYWESFAAALDAFVSQVSP